ncbi:MULTISPECIES: hypothetical protein [unclassified Streptomyces]|uniref:hypothetical protein n=1 Tax=unclassified Streptomyces TaxID=2593676 RepID=UPI002258486C|nr:MULTISPECIES: hypothetical protein [unclassified Streptomyces]MCX4880568.1 hypothetical protein [Streptomyces sp. NBC_00847]MCX5420550.1 hypothetical protein [Streptomyces sp. NBC_00078]
MHSYRGPTGRDLGHGERFLFAVALVAVSLLWITQDMAAWATALCGVGVAVGVSATLCFGWRYIRSRGASR